VNRSTGIASDPVAFLESLLSASGDCIKVLDIEGNLIFMTDAGQRLMEVTDFGAIKGCPWPDFWHGIGNTEAKAAVAAAQAGGTGHFEGFATTMAGTPKWWDVTVTPIFGADGKPEKLLSVSRDITASHTAKRELIRSEARFKAYAQAMPNQVWSATPDGQLDWFNDQVYTYSGLAFDDLLGVGWAQMVHPDDIGVAAEVWRKALAEATLYQMQFRLRRADGSFRWHIARALPIKDDHGAITRWIGTNTDIDDQKAIERQLTESEQRAATAVDAADIGIWDFDPRTGVLKWDRRCYELFGLTPGKPISYDVFLQGLHPEDRDATNQACVEAMRPDGPLSYDIEYRTIGLDDGIERWISAKGKSEVEDGMVVRFIGTVRDISGLKAAQAHRELLAHELEHRMKNTMAMVSAIATQSFRAAETKEEAQTILGGRLHALNSAHDILTKSNWTGASMPVVIESALAPHLSGEGRMRISGPDVELTAKQSLSLAMALHELTTNAIKYGALSLASGTIDIHWNYRFSDEGPVLRFEWRERGGPAVTEPARRGFGSRLIERTLSADFGGSVNIEYAPQGLICHFETKLSDLRAGGNIPLAPAL
jgi:PAS domain S-box-containing protein